MLNALKEIFNVNYMQLIRFYAFFNAIKELYDAEVHLTFFSSSSLPTDVARRMLASTAHVFDEGI